MRSCSSPDQETVMFPGGMKPDWAAMADGRRHACDVQGTEPVAE
jgi:hypothetical protein